MTQRRHEQPSSTAPDDWDRHWADYGDWNARNPAQQYRRCLILSLIAEGHPPERVLDIGCGTGDLAADVRRAFPKAEILGLDASAAGLEIARGKVPDATFVQRDLLAPGEPEAPFRAWATHAVCSEVLEHLERPRDLLRNAGTYLAPGCRLIVTVPGGPMSAYDRHIGHRAHYDSETIASTLEASGFEVERAMAAGYPFFNLYRLAVIARGRRLVDVAASGRTPALAGIAMRIFAALFRVNLRSSPWGWQIVAVARLP
jgi:trans-aconitate methyltransferase